MSKKSKHYIIKVGDFTVADARRNPGMGLAISRWVDKTEYESYKPEQQARSMVKALIEIDTDDTVTLDAGRDARPRYCLCKVKEKLEYVLGNAQDGERHDVIYTVCMQSMGVAPKKSVRESAAMTIY